MKEMLKTIHVVGMGMGPGDLGPSGQRIVDAAEVLAGGRRQLDWFPDHPAEKLALSANLTEWLDALVREARDKRVVVLSSGDPNFFGVADRVTERAGVENVRIHPNVTTVQSAFARLKEPWDGVAVVSLHGRNEEALYSAVQENDRVAVFTDPVHTPDRIARLLLDRGQSGWRMAVFENLGRADARVGFHRLHEAAELEFSQLNLVALWRKGETAPLALGMPDEAFEHEAGLITKTEVRAVALARLNLAPGLTLWDLGAGCGSVGIEASLLLRGGRVVAVERRPERLAQIVANRTRFGVATLEVVEGDLPDGLAGLPVPDRIFIGGGGVRLGEIVRESGRRLTPGGVMVISAVRLDSVAAARDALVGPGYETDVTQVQISRGKPLAGDEYLKALNPVWLITGKKPE